LVLSVAVPCPLGVSQPTHQFHERRPLAVHQHPHAVSPGRELNHRDRFRVPLRPYSAPIRRLETKSNLQHPIGATRNTRVKAAGKDSAGGRPKGGGRKRLYEGSALE
jgi:hypothetical protein